MCDDSDDDCDGLLMCEQSYVTASEAAKLIGFSAVRTRELVREGKLRGSKIPGTKRWRIPCEEITRFKEHGSLSPEESDELGTTVLPALVRDVLRQALDKLDALHPHQVMHAMLDTDQLAQKALSLAFPGADAKSLYDSGIQLHARKSDSKTATFEALYPYRKHLQESGLWSYVETWEQCFRDNLDLLTDLSVTVSLYVHDLFQSILKDAEPDRDEQNWRAELALLPGALSGDMRAAFTDAALPNFAAAVLFSDLLALSAGEQPTNPIWAGELLALKDLRTRVVVASQTLWPRPFNWSNFDKLATKIWKEPELFGDECEKAVAASNGYVKVERAKVEMRENFLQALSES